MPATTWTDPSEKRIPLSLVVDGVGHEQVDAEPVGHLGRREQDTLRLVEDAFATPAGALALQVLLEVHDLVVGRVADDEGPVGQGDRLAREAQRRVGGGRRDVGVVARLERALGPVLLDEAP